MSPESSDYMGLADWSIDQARIILEAGAFEVAAREAYSAALGVARAIIFEKTGRAPKTHSGTRSELGRLIHSGLAFEAGLAEFLADAFEVKLTVDYGPVQKMSRAEAEAYIERATAFLAEAKRVLQTR